MAAEKKATTIVIDCGSYEVKAGLSGDSAPKAVFSNLIGPHDQEQTLHRIFDDELGIPATGTRVMVLDHLTATKETRKVTAEILYGLGVESVYFAFDAVTALYAKGKQDGVSVDIGHQHSYAVPMVKGYASKPYIQYSEMTGEALEKFLATLLVQSGHQRLSETPKLVRELKEKFCTVASDGASADVSVTKGVLALPLSKNIEKVDMKWSKCAEALFDPSLAGLSGDGIHKLIEKAIVSCEEGMQAELWENIYLASGVTEYSGFSERLQSELVKLNPSAKVTYFIPTTSTWIGGSILASLPQVDEKFVTKQQYKEKGADILMVI